MDVQAYLTKLGSTQPSEPNLSSLSKLTNAHVRSIPFDNLSTHLGEKSSLDLTDLEAKMLMQQRGGTCCELNLLFAELLRSIGYHTRLLTAACWSPGPGTFSEPVDHMALSVSCPADPHERVLVDVGYGNCLKVPMAMHTGAVQQLPGVTYSLGHDEGYHVLLRQRDDGGWVPIYRFLDQPHHPDEFVETLNGYLAPGTRFDRHWTCARATDLGWVRLTDATLTWAEPPEDRTSVLPSPAAVREQLSTTFGIELPPGRELRLTEQARNAWSSTGSQKRSTTAGGAR